jgi:Domain of unknown function (DUF4278)
MKLIYRGATYDSETFKAANDRSVPRETLYTLQYRGVSYQVNHRGETVEMPPQTFGQKISGVTDRVTPQPEVAPSPVQTFTRQLIYRGNPYWVNRSV